MLNDLRRESVSFIQVRWIFHLTILNYPELTCQYPWAGCQRHDNDHCVQHLSMSASNSGASLFTSRRTGDCDSSPVPMHASNADCNLSGSMPSRPPMRTISERGTSSSQRPVSAKSYRLPTIWRT